MAKDLSVHKSVPRASSKNGNPQKDVHVESQEPIDQEQHQQSKRLAQLLQTTGDQVNTLESSIEERRRTLNYKEEELGAWKEMQSVMESFAASIRSQDKDKVEASKLMLSTTQAFFAATTNQD